MDVETIMAEVEAMRAELVTFREQASRLAIEAVAERTEATFTISIRMIELVAESESSPEGKAALMRARREIAPPFMRSATFRETRDVQQRSLRRTGRRQAARPHHHRAPRSNAG